MSTFTKYLLEKDFPNKNYKLVAILSGATPYKEIDVDIVILHEDVNNDINESDSLRTWQFDGNMLQDSMLKEITPTFEKIYAKQSKVYPHSLKKPKFVQKHFLAKTRIQDGENAYTFFNIYSARTLKQAEKISKQEDKDFSFDFTREFETEFVEEITADEEKILRKFGVI